MMEKFWKYFLSAFLLMFFSCEYKFVPNPHIDRAALSKKIFLEENQKHGFNFLFQGTPRGMTLLDSILALDSTNSEALRAVSAPYLKRGLPHKWKPWFDKAVKNNPEAWQPWRGYLYLWFYRDYKKAIADFNASDSLTPYIDYPQGHSVYYWRGIAYSGPKDYEESIAYFDKHIAYESEQTGEDWVEREAFVYRGIAHYENQQFDEALADFDKTIVLFTFSADAKFYKARILAEQGQRTEALALVDQAIDDYQKGFYNHRPYVEALRQLYPKDFAVLKSSLLP